MASRRPRPRRRPDPHRVAAREAPALDGDLDTPYPGIALGDEDEHVWIAITFAPITDEESRS
jgi:hypothetical protein